MAGLPWQLSLEEAGSEGRPATAVLLFATNVNYLLITSKQRLGWQRAGREPAKGIYSPGQWDMDQQLLLAGSLLEFRLIPPISQYLSRNHLGSSPG